MSLLISPICTILVGLFVALVLPKWVKYGSRKRQNKIRFYMNITGIIIIIVGALTLYSRISLLLAE